VFGRIFQSMYEGSMYGRGFAVFAVWDYALAHVRRGRVELNPVQLADVLAKFDRRYSEEERLVVVKEAIEYLMAPDPESRFRGNEGRRLIREGQFQYFLPSWEEYQRIRSEDERREYNRVKQAEYREPGYVKKKKVRVPLVPTLAERNAIKGEDPPRAPHKLIGIPPEELDWVPAGEKGVEGVPGIPEGAP